MRLGALLPVGVVLLFLSAAACPLTAAELTVHAGTVVDASGNPLSGVKVEPVIHAIDPIVPAITGEDGSFDLASGQSIYIKFSKPGFLSKTILSPGGETPLHIELTRLASARIRVVDSDRAPIPSASVSLSPAAGSQQELSDLSPARVDKNGEVAFLDVIPGPYSLTVEASGFQLHKQELVPLLSGKPYSRVITLSRRVTARGSIHGPEGKEIAGMVAIVARQQGGSRAIYDRAHQIVALAATEDNGSFELTVPDGQRLPVYVLGWSPGFAPELASLSPVAGKEGPYQFHLETGGSLVGKVANESGRPVQDALLHCLGEFTQFLGEEKSRFPVSVNLSPLFSDREEDDPVEPQLFTNEGAFDLAGLPAGKISLFPAFPSGLPAKLVEFELAEGERQEDVVVTLEQGNILEGVVRDEAGDPIEGARVVAIARRHHDPEVEAVTDELGYFLLYGFWDAVLDEVRISLKSMGTKNLQRVDTSQGLLEVTLEPSGTLIGLILDSTTGQPIEELEIELSPYRKGDLVLGTAEKRTSSHPEGSLSLDGIAEGEYLVKIGSSRHRTKSIEQVKITAGGTTDLSAIQLDLGFEISGTIRSVHDDAPLQGAEVRLFDLGNPAETDYRQAETIRYEKATSDLQGSFSFPGLLAGRYFLRIMHENSGGWASEIDLSDTTNPVRLELELGEGGSVEVLALDAEGDPQPDLRLFALWADDPLPKLGGYPTTQAWGKTDSAGKVLLERLPPGKYRISRGQFGVEHDAPIVELEEGLTKKAVLQDRRPTVFGKITYRGQVLPNTGIRISQEKRHQGTYRVSMGITDTVQNQEGYRTKPISPGDYTLEAQASIPDPLGGGNPVQLKLRKTFTVPTGTSEVRVDGQFPGYILRGRLLRSDTNDPIDNATLHVGDNRVRTDVNGEFSLVFDHPGPHRPQFIAPNAEFRGWVLEETQPVLIPSEPGVVDLVLHARPGSVLQGHILDKSGKPVPNAWVKIEPDAVGEATSRPLPFLNLPLHLEGDPTGGTKPRVGFSDSAGGYTKEGSPGGTYLLSVSHPNYATHWEPGVAFSEGELRKDIVLAEDAPLRLEFPLFDENGIPRAYEFLLRNSRVPGVIRIAKNVALGTNVRPMGKDALMVRNLPKGSWSIQATIEGKSFTESTQLSEGEVTTVSFR